MGTEDICRTFSAFLLDDKPTQWSIIWRWASECQKVGEPVPWWEGASWHNSWAGVIMGFIKKVSRFFSNIIPIRHFRSRGQCSSISPASILTQAIFKMYLDECHFKYRVEWWLRVPCFSFIKASHKLFSGNGSTSHSMPWYVSLLSYNFFCKKKLLETFLLRSITQIATPSPLSLNPSWAWLMLVLHLVHSEQPLVWRNFWRKMRQKCCKDLYHSVLSGQLTAWVKWISARRKYKKVLYFHIFFLQFR